MEVEKFHVVEWTIENFSCWNREIHGEPITSPKYSSSDTSLELILKPSRGQDEQYLAARLRKYGQSVKLFVGELSFIGPDGSILCTQQVDSTKEDKAVLELPAGPTIKEVVARIKKNLKGDRLTVRFREKSSTHSIEYRRTTIRAFDAFFKITPDLLKSSSSSTEISWVHYPLFGDGLRETHSSGKMVLYASKDQLDHAKIELAVTNSNHVVSIHIRMTVLKNEDVVVRTEENERLLRKEEKWTFSNSLTREEVEREGFSLMLHFKIMPKINCMHSVDLRSGSTQAFSTIPSIEFRHLSTTAPKNV